MATKTYTSKTQSTQAWITGLLQQGESVRFTAFGPSMHPAIQSGESVWVRPVGNNNIRKGSILLFKLHGRLVLHRFVRRHRDSRLITVADAALDGCELVERDNVLGSAISVNRKGREKRLNVWFYRYRGWLRYQTRPLRRAVIHMWHNVR